MAEKKRYPFLNLIIDIFFGITIFTSFTLFRGFNLGSILLFFSIFLMANYWWAIRSYSKYPKHYLFDFYFLIIISMIFYQLAVNYAETRNFIFILGALFLADAVWSITSGMVHEEKADRKALRFDFATEITLAAFYFALWLFVRELNYAVIAAIIIPCLIYFALNVRKGLISLKYEGV